MTRPLVIIHGWSDNYRSFRRLARLLQQRGVCEDVKHVRLGNYISMDDEVTFADLTSALQRAWKDNGLPTSARSVDVVVHSTGGLVIRDWLTTFHQPDQSPIYHLLMLAPANFGSPLAHKGNAFMGRVIKGFKSKKMFQTGTKILQGLELASPYSWDLAQKDRFSSKEFYKPGRILCTVLVGNKGYSGISAAANEDGSDGTVRVSTANMNCTMLDLDFCTDPQNPKPSFKNSTGKTAFAVIEGDNHGTLAGKDGGPKNPATLDIMTEALTLSDSEFDGFCSRLDAETKKAMENGVEDNYRHGYQNTVVFVTDQFESHVDDYFLEFFVDDKDSGWFTELFQRDAIRTVHAYGDDKSYRSVYVDCTLLYEEIDKVGEALKVSLTALPEYRVNKNVGYTTFAWDDIGSLSLDPRRVRRVFKPNRTLLTRIKLNRKQSEKVFEIKTV